MSQNELRVDVAVNGKQEFLLLAGKALGEFDVLAKAAQRKD